MLIRKMIITSWMQLELTLVVIYHYKRCNDLIYSLNFIMFFKHNNVFFISKEGGGIHCLNDLKVLNRICMIFLLLIASKNVSKTALRNCKLKILKETYDNNMILSIHLDKKDKQDCQFYSCYSSDIFQDKSFRFYF